ncbi:sigma-54-dependent transcriptional regulator [Marinibaculum pumilum]|uniref:Sigma-54-dependent transcriptional regulator n=1 Tax=Marinibaculum pumilum TaxID=1766165 RepID=A0ABV7L0I4_9PROT
MRLIIIGTLNGQIGAASKIAMDRGAKVTQVDTIDAAMEQLRRGQGADLALVDVHEDIRRLVGQLAQERFSLPVVACGIGNDSRAAVDAIRAGAKEYLPLPPEAELIAAVLEAVAEESHQLIYRDPAIRQVLELADQVAKSTASILITGESGTGKEVLARYIHGKSDRSGNAFISVNCAAIPDNLLESELFGHEKGAFTGAVARRIGKFEEAHGGTLLLDEVTEMDVRLQAKLLRAIQEREIDRVGGGRPVQVDLRVIATSNRDLAKAVAEGQFREDLFFRLNVVNLKLPPLRERPEDIEVLAKHFADKYAKANGLPPRPLSAGALKMAQAYRWQGNVRELENTMHRAVLLAQGPEIGEAAMRLPDGSPLAASARPAASPGPGTAAPAGEAPPAAKPAESAGGEAGPLEPGTETTGARLVGQTVADVERTLIIDTLNHCLGNRTHAANILGISIRTLRNKLKQYSDEGVQVPMPGEGQRAAY